MFLVLFTAVSLLCPIVKAASNTQMKVVPGDNVYTILKRHGFNDQQRKEVIGQSNIPEDFVLSPGNVYWIKSIDKKNKEIIFFDQASPNAFKFQIDARKNVRGERLSVNYDVRTQTARGVIRGSLVESISKATGDDLIPYRFMDAYLLDYNLAKDLKRNARFEVTYEKLYFQGQLIRVGEVLKASLELNGQTVVRTYRDLKSGGRVFIDPDMSLSNRRFFAPVDQIRISSLFQKRRFHPIRKLRRAHEGVDFELPIGEPVYSIADGVVLRSGRNRAAGRFVVIRHNGGFESFYNHLSWLKGLTPGQPVVAGTKIGEIGCSGYCTKAHLHFAIKKSGQFVNPVYLIRNYSFNQRQEVFNLVASRRL